MIYIHMLGLSSVFLTYFLNINVEKKRNKGNETFGIFIIVNKLFQSRNSIVISTNYNWFLF